MTNNTLIINYTTAATQGAYDALKASDIGLCLRPGQAVAIKPNLVVPRPANLGATTHPELVEGIILFLQAYGIKDISIIESSAIGESTKAAFRNCGYETLAEKYGVSLFDLKNDATTTLSHNGLKLALCNRALHADFLINVPVLKSHSQTRMTCSLKNMKGCIPDSEKRRYHSLGLDKPIAALNALVKTHFCVVDGICGDLSFEEGGNPVAAGRIIAGANPVMVDSFCAELIGLRPDDIGHLKLARDLGIGEYYTEQTPVLEMNKENKTPHIKKAARLADRYSRLIEEDSACSACYASLIYALHRLGGSVGGEKIHIGQGFRGKSGPGIGIGNCAAGFSRHVSGCPPRAVDIVGRL